MTQDQGHLLGRRYRLLSVVGRGGMGTVWRARDEVLHRDVAVKEVRFPSGLNADDERVLYERTFREARASARLNHPNVVALHDVLEEDGRPWIVMQFVEARSLQHILDEEGPLSPRRAAGIGHQTLTALHHAHAAGILHRDVKPSNVLITGDGRAVLTDFGIAQVEGDTTLTQTGLVMGSPAYIPPERAQGERAVPASDLWALGATLYAAVEGRPPYDREDAVAALAAALTEPVPPARGAGPLRPVLDGLLARDPARRVTADQALPMLDEVARPRAEETIVDSPAAPLAHRPEDPPTARFHDTEQTLFDPSMFEAAANRAQGAGPHEETEWVPPEFAPWHPGAAAAPARRRERTKTVLIVGVAAVLVVTALVSGALILRSRNAASGRTSGDEKTISQSAGNGGTNGGTNGSANGGASQTSDGGVPDGYRTATENGFSVAIPDGWTRRTVNNSVFWDSPGKTTFVQIDQTPWTGTPSEEAYKAHVNAPGSPSFPGYALTRISAMRYQDADAADWEFTFDDPGGRGTVRAKDRFFRGGGHSYAIYFRTLDRDWPAAQTYLETFLRTFRAT
jgi:tRNA A-37 threonylcarbamoyl transferase component Bud32